jgi:predicted small lipoprotein YifL
MKVVMRKRLILLTLCGMLMACGQAGRLYIPKPDITTQTSPGAKADESNTQIRQNAWPR